MATTTIDSVLQAGYSYPHDINLPVQQALADQLYDTTVLTSPAVQADSRLSELCRSKRWTRFFRWSLNPAFIVRIFGVTIVEGQVKCRVMALDTKGDPEAEVGDLVLFMTEDPTYFSEVEDWSTAEKRVLRDYPRFATTFLIPHGYTEVEKHYRTWGTPFRVTKKK